MAKDKLIQENNKLLAKLVKRQSLPYRFLAGLMYGLGATLGVALIFALIGFILSKLQVIPIVGGFLSNILNEAIKNINYQPFQHVVH